MLFVIPFLRSRRSAYCGLAIAAMLLQPGCDNNVEPKPSAPVIDTGPQAKFDRVVAELRRRLAAATQSGGGRYTTRDPYGTLSTVTSFEVQAPEKITLPSKPGQLPTARIKVIRQSSYLSLSSAKQDEEETAGAASDEEKGDLNSSVPQELESMGIEVLDPEMAEEDFAKAVAPRVRVPDFSTRQNSANTETIYDLVFENNRWRMAGPPAADAPESSNDAITVALKRQK